MSEIDQLLKFMWENDLPAESCNILQDPKHLRIELMPDNIRRETIDRLKILARDLDLEKKNILNTRHRDNIKDSIADLCLEYLNFMETYEIPKDAAEQRRNLVRFLKAFESLRKNRITDHAPKYQEFLAALGY